MPGYAESRVPGLKSQVSASYTRPTMILFGHFVRHPIKTAQQILSRLLVIHASSFELLFVSVSSSYQPPSHHRPFLSGRPPPSPWSLVAATGRGLVSPPCTRSVYFLQNTEDVLNSPGDWAILVRPSSSPSSRLHQHLHRWYHREQSGRTSS